ncbi:flocculation suppression protein [Verticillium alfalfae VaMs.102]|uniref:Flocculation suppression protein n=1 Tax=Verticillium alfalfae (strain VaMs.102 / ATCC MYA-4576 / FGSC 10136) TaxID=526221 RepID=C9SL70_VERA1|nr:flocculation suppression protein [Verticillium alfalfae VaMs.102]EEY19438.1 flocculation suppression protein [Verticillium alfalfae VaMs.102]
MRYVCTVPSLLFSPLLSSFPPEIHASPCLQNPNPGLDTAQMAAAIESQQAVPLPPDGHDGSSPSTTTRIVPIPTPTIQTSAPSPGDPMEITTPTTAGGRSPPHSQNGTSINGGSNNNSNGNGSGTPESSAKNTSPGASQPAGHMSSMPAPPAAAAAAVHQPKIVQTAFIHKLYNMLEDPSIQHLISWSPTAESFVMSPSPDFSKVLAQYFKHTNISSFVRQLNMYGFHKGNPDMALWEFKHGNGNFKRGDLVGLREIKRRASRHALVHRDYPNTKPSTSQPGTPAEPMPPPPPESAETRGGSVEHALYDLSMRLQRSEESAHFMHIKHQAVMETMTRLLQFNQELSRAVLGLVPDQGHPSEMHRQADLLRSVDEPEPPFSASRSYFSNIENAPVSPRQMPQDDPRRTNLTVPSARAPSDQTLRRNHLLRCEEHRHLPRNPTRSRRLRIRRLIRLRESCSSAYLGRHPGSRMARQSSISVIRTAIDTLALVTKPHRARGSAHPGLTFNVLIAVRLPASSVIEAGNTAAAF